MISHLELSTDGASLHAIHGAGKREKVSCFVFEVQSVTPGVADVCGINAN